MQKRKNKIQNVLTLKDVYQEYEKNIKVKSSLLNIDYKTFKNICVDFNKKLSSKILNEAYTFKVPYQLGEIRIKKFKMKLKRDKLRINYKLTKEYKKTIYFLNEHTDNNAYRWYWDKQKALKRCKMSYCFVATRANKRALAKAILSDKGMDYFN